MTTNNGQLKKTKISLLGAVGIIYSLAAAGAYGVEEMISSSGPGLTIFLGVATGNDDFGIKFRIAVRGGRLQVGAKSNG